jgi:Flp pilus assembly protein TadB
MSAARSTRDNRAPAARAAHPRPPEMAHLRARRREARRKRRVARIDIGIGVFVAIVLLLATPGLAITGLVVLGILLLCGASVVRERRRARDAGHAHDAAPLERGPQPPNGAPAAVRRSSTRVARSRPRSTR